MHILFIVGRVLLVLIFIYSGAGKLLDLTGTAAYIAPVVTVPDGLSEFATQLQEMTGMTVPHLLALLAGVVELVAGLLIVFNIGTSGAAAVLVLFTIATIFYFHDFWNMAGAARDANLIHALKNLSITGGLLVFVVLGSWRLPPSRSQV
jgi:putative oxidoreductase